MRFFVLCALLFNVSPIPAAAGSLVEGGAGAAPVIRPTIAPKSLLPVRLDELNLEHFEMPDLADPHAVPIVDPGAFPVVLNVIDPSVLAAEMQAQLHAAEPKASAPAVLPGLQNVETKLEEGRSAPGAAQGESAGEESVLEFAYDRRADGDGAQHAPVALGEESVSDHHAALDAGAERGAQALPSAPPAVPAPVDEPPRWHRIFPNMITTANLWSGLAGAYLASQGKIGPTVAAIIAANVFDMFDGRTARALKVKNPLGIDYDSLADVVSFGVAPALLIFKAALLPALGIWGFPIAALFATAGWFRLSRFNVGAHAEEAGAIPHNKSDSFTGLPIPGGAGVIAATALALSALPALWVAPVAVGMTLLAAGAMASRLPYPAFKKGGVKALLAPAAVGLAAVIPLALLGLYSFIPAAVFGLYLLTGPLIALWRGGSDAWKKELQRKRFHQLILLTIPLFYLVGTAHAAITAAAAVGIVGLLEFIRLKVPAARPFFDRWFGSIIRAKEADRMSGSFYTALGLGTVAVLVALLHLNPLLFPAAALALVWGDAASPLVGLRFGFKPFTVMGTRRSVDGAAAGFTVALAIGLALGFPWLAALGAAAAFSVVDTLPVKPDDNLWIPIVFSAALALLSLI